MIQHKYKVLPVMFFFCLFLPCVLLSALPSRDNQNAELRFGVMSEPATLDPVSPSNTADGRSVLFNVYEGLVKSDTSGRLLPAAAESFNISKDALVYTFTLRGGLKFQDGTAVTASDAEFSLNEAKKNNFIGLGNINKIETSGDRVVIITLNDPDPDFLPYLTVGIVPKNNTDRENNPIGTGPFKIEKYSPQQELVLVKNPYYWQSGLPKTDRVTVVFSGDNNALYTGLEGGNINGAMVTPDVLGKLDQKKYEIVTGYSNSVQMMALNNSVKPLNDIRVRQALNYAIDVKDIIDSAFYGRGEPSGSPLIPGLKLYYNETLKDPYPFDIAKAKTLLTDAGYPNGFDLEIKVPSNYAMHIDTAQVIINQLAKINVHATIRLVDWATWLTDVYRGRNYEATVISLDGSTISPQSFLSRYVSSSASNFLNFKSDTYDKLFAQILTETNEDTRIQMYKQAQKIISDEAAAVYIQDIYAFQVFSGGFRGALTYPLYVLDFSVISRN
ncbi:MAG: ABC transporter substrate-binding protein [Treponema sp.]|nr:ABC transporter substrate-binding protein [Treponema sp.]